MTFLRPTEGRHAGLAGLAYELSLRALDQQERVLNDLRGRAGTLLAASAVVASFLGGLALSAGDVTVLSAVALLAFALSIGGCIPILLPRPDLVFALRGSVLFEAEYADPGGLVETYRRLSYWLDRYRDANQPAIERLFSYYRAAAMLLLAQIVLWSVELALS